MNDDSFGELQLTQMHEPGATRLWIDRADPRVRVAAPILDAARSGEALFTSVDGDLLTVKAENRTVTYRIGACHEAEGWYEAKLASA